MISIKAKLNFFGIFIALLTLTLVTISIAWVLTTNNITQSTIELQKNMKMVQSELESNKKRLLSSSQKIAELQELSLKIKHIVRYKNNNNKNIQPLYIELANAIHDSGKIAGNICKTMIYDDVGDLISFSHIEQNFSKKGYVYNFPKALFVIADGKDLASSLNNTWEESFEYRGFDAQYKQKILSVESIIYTNSCSQLTLKSFYPIMGLKFDKELRKMKPSQVGFVLSKNPIGVAFIDKIKKLIGDKEINIYLSNNGTMNLTVGSLKEYKTFDKTSFVNQKVTIEGVSYIQELLPLYNEDKIIGAIALLEIEKTITDYVLELLESLILVFVVILFIVIPLTLLLIRTITNPIVNLQKGITELSIGNLGKQLEIYSKDEIGELTKSFNAMSKDLAKTDKIKILNTELKQTSSKLKSVNKNIQDSIVYASLIQHSILPNKDILKEYCEDSFIYWEPKDTVGGDIYFITELQSKEEIIIMMIDGAGHGVAGAFVTMLVKAIERQIISDIEYKKLSADPSKILEYFNKSIKTMLKQEKGSRSNAGFDGGVLCYNKKTKQCKYAGAKTDLYIVEDDELKVVKGDMKNVGFARTKITQQYTLHNIAIKENTKLYLTTDGIFDQEGKNKTRYGIDRFEKEILEISNNSFDIQKEIVVENFNNFKQNIKQTDDVTVVGFNFK